MSKSKTQPKRSEIDPTRIITDEYWAVSIVRLPDSSNSQHAFLVLEGVTGNNSIIWFGDFVANDAIDLVRPGMREGKVRLYKYESKGVVDSSTKLLFQCPLEMMKIEKGNRIIFSTWLIPKDTADKLAQNIERQQSNPPQYNLLGDTALAGSTGAVKGKPTGHNCFTFARKMLLDLGDEYIDIPQDTLGKWLVTATYRYLPDKLMDKPWWNGVQFTLFVIGVIVVIAIGVQFFLKRLNEPNMSSS